MFLHLSLTPLGKILGIQTPNSTFTETIYVVGMYVSFFGQAFIEMAAELI